MIKGFGEIIINRCKDANEIIRHPFPRFKLRRKFCLSFPVGERGNIEFRIFLFDRLFEVGLCAVFVNIAVEVILECILDTLVASLVIRADVAHVDLLCSFYTFYAL